MMIINGRSKDPNFGWISIWDMDRLIRARAEVYGLEIEAPYPLNFKKLIDMLINCGLWAFHPNEAVLERLKLQPLIAETFARRVWRQNFRLEEVFRSSDWKEYPDWDSLRRDKVVKNLVNLEAELWDATFKMLERMSSLNAISCHVLTAFWLLSEEPSWLSFQLRLDEKSGTQSLRDWQKQHGDIRNHDRDHPFDKNEFPIAFRVFTAAKKLESQNQSFRDSYYSPALKARQNLIKQMTADALSVTDRDGRTSTQGRRKSRPSKSQKSLRKKRS